MRKILLRLAYLIIGAVAILVLCCLTDFWLTTSAHGQNVEGQPIASQYGSFQVTGQSIGGFSFPPATCQVPAGGKNIDAFTAGVPIKIIDGDPTKTEIATPSSVFIGTCSVNMATTYTHQPPYSLTSGTGGLQEALINAKVRQGGPNTIILDANWYEQVKPGVAATVIAAAHGSTSWGLVDVTTAPYTYYSWNGSQYVSAGVAPPSGAAGGGLTGTYPDPGLNSTAVANALNGQTIAFFGISTQTINTTKLGNLYEADGFTSGLYLGINQAPVAWVSGTTYPSCQEVTNSGTTYIATNKANGATTPGTNSAIWWPLVQPSGAGPTSLNCAFYWALANAGTSTTGGSNAVLALSGNTNSGVYGINDPLIMPPKGAQVEIIGTAQGDNGTPVSIVALQAMQTMIWKPSLTSASSTPYSLTLRNVNLNGNGLAQEGFWFSGAKLGVVEHVRVTGMIGTTDWVRFGDSSAPSGEGANYQWVVNDIQLNTGGGTPAIVTPVVSGGVLSITVNTPGTYNYYVSQGVIPQVYIWGTGPSGTSNQPCGTMGTATAVMSGSGLASVSLSGFSSDCGGTIYVKVPDIPAAGIGINIDDVTDSSFNDLVVNNVGTIAGIVVNHSGNSFVHAHPYGASLAVGIISNNQNMFVNTELDSLFMYGAEPYFADNWSNTNFTYNALLPGAKGFYNRYNGMNSLGNSCGGTTQTGQGFALVTTSSGDIAHGVTAAYPALYEIVGQQCDDSSLVNVVPYVRLGQPLVFGFNPSASTPQLTLNGLFSGGTTTTNVPNLYFQGASGNPPSTWDIGGTYLGGNAFNGFAGNWFDFHIHGGPSVAKLTAAGALTVSSCTGCGSGSSGLSGMTAGQVPIAATASTVTSSEALAGAGSAITTGPSSSTSGDVTTFTGTAGQIADSGTALSSLAPLASPAFTGTPTAPTQAVSTNNTDIATTAAVTSALAGYLPVSGYYAGTATGLVNVLAATLSPVPASQTALQGIPVSFLPNLANTTTTPTVNLNSLGAQTIVKCGSTALAAGDLSTTAVAVVIWNGTNMQLQNPQAAICQTGSSGAFTAGGTVSNGTIELISSTFRALTSSTSVTYQGGGDNGSSGGGSGIFRGSQNNNANAAGSASLEAGANTSTGQQGFANVQQSFTVASALAATFEAVTMTTTADQVAASALGATNVLGIAQTVGGTNTQLYVVSTGKTTTRFDGTPVIGDLACAPPASTGTIGLAHDNGSTACPAGQKLGIVTGQVSGTGSGATATVLLQIGS